MNHPTGTRPSALLHKNGSSYTASTSQDEVIEQLPLKYSFETSMTGTSTSSSWLMHKRGGNATMRARNTVTAT